MNKQLIRELDELLCVTLENAATPEQVDRLNALMESGDTVREYVADYCFIAAALRRGNLIALASLGTQNELSELNSLLDEMAREEQAAPVIEIEPEPQPKERTYRKIEVVQPARKVNRFSLGLAIASMAAFFFLLAYLRSIPPSESVAVVEDLIAAQWYGSHDDIKAGYTFYNTDDPVLLKEGYVEIEFDYGATVVIEGPSEFVCKSDNQIYLNYGRLYACVPEEATGFTVETENSRIVDLGTEFGVQVNVNGTTELFVHEGLTKLLMGKEQEKKVYSVAAGDAKEVSSDGESIIDILFKKENFVKQIDSGTNLIYKGQNELNLADIVGGGNGLGTGRRNVALDPVSGQLAGISELDRNRTAENEYLRISRHPFVDGVFVPNGQTPQVVTSLGHVFEECPVTQGNYYVGVSNAPENIDRQELVLGGVNYSQSEISSLFLHANLGVTYDLQAIRSELPGEHLKRFRSIVGVCDSAWRPCNLDLWILVDGQVRYSREKIQQKGILDTVEIELSDNDRFLTLIATDGGDPPWQTVGNISVTSMDSDWCLFAEPVLALE